jgi:hypothetical protein
MKNILTFCLVLVIAAGCDDRLDVKPHQSIDQATALSTEKDVVVTLVGAYDGLQEEGTYGGDLMTLSELMGNTDDILFTGTFDGLSDIFKLQTVATNENALRTWRYAYSTINRVNNVLSAIDKVTSSEEEHDRVEGEARFIRASMYFELVRYYAKTWDDGDNTSNPGVPLVLEPTTTITEADYRARNTVAEVYDQVIQDLTLAEELLPLENNIYANKAAAGAVLARVKLTQGVKGETAAQKAALADARDAASRVIDYGTNELADDIGSLWYTFLDNDGNSPSEYIFSMKVTQQDGFNAMNQYFGVNVGDGTNGRADIKITNAHLAKYEAGDARGEFFVVVGGRNYTQKHLDNYGNVLVVRLAEMYLTRAEANYRLGTNAGADPVDDVNVIRERAGLDPLASIADVKTILNERYLELAFEGSHLHDAKRTRGTVSGVPWNDSRLILPIPQREIDTNKSLNQNDGY